MEYDKKTIPPEIYHEYVTITAMMEGLRATTDSGKRLSLLCVLVAEEMLYCGQEECLHVDMFFDLFAKHLKIELAKDSALLYVN